MHCLHCGFVSIRMRSMRMCSMRMCSMWMCSMSKRPHGNILMEVSSWRASSRSTSYNMLTRNAGRPAIQPSTYAPQLVRFQPPPSPAPPIALPLSLNSTNITFAQSGQGSRRQTKVGRNRIPRPPRERRPLHEHPARRRNRIREGKELRDPGTGSDPVCPSHTSIAFA